MRFLRNALEVAAYAAGSFFAGVTLLVVSPFLVVIVGIMAVAILTEHAK